MEMLKSSFRKRKDSDKSPITTSWPEDEEKVRNGTCHFEVRYLGSIEVFESSGIQVCEDAAKVLKTQSKGKYKKAVLHVSGDTLRIVDDNLKTLIIDQAIERVAFCSPDRHHEKGFAYICRDGATKRWMCHAFLSAKEPGERLSHAVGCAFNICLEKKQQRDKDNVKVSYNESKTSFTRTGSFRQATISERLADPQSTIIPDTVKIKSKSVEISSVERPRASASMLLRQSSFKGFGQLADTSMFKRQSSLRLNDLPSTVDRHNQLHSPNSTNSTNLSTDISNNTKLSTTTSSQTITQMCQQLQSLAALSTDDPFAQISWSPPSSVLYTQSDRLPVVSTCETVVPHYVPQLQQQSNLYSRSQLHHPLPNSFDKKNELVDATNGSSATAPRSSRRLSDADQWLESISSSISPAEVFADDPFNTRPFVVGQQQRSRSRSVDTGEYNQVDRSYKSALYSGSGRTAYSQSIEYAGVRDPFDVSWVKHVVARPETTT